MTAKTDKGVWVKSLDIQCRQRIMQAPSSDRHIQRLATGLELEKTMRGGEKCYFITLDKLWDCLFVNSIEQVKFIDDDNLDHHALMLPAGGRQNDEKIADLTTQVGQMADTCRTLSVDIAEKSEKITKLKKQLEVAKTDAEIFKERFLTACEQLRIAHELLKNGKGNTNLSPDVLNRMLAIEDMNAKLIDANNEVVKAIKEIRKEIETLKKTEPEDVDDDDIEEIQYEEEPEEEITPAAPVRMSVFRSLRNR